MERLTDCAQGYCEVYCDHYTSCFSEPDTCERKHEVQLYERLKDYEGTGLEPEKIEQMKARLPLHNWAEETPDKLSIFGATVAHIQELLRAEKDGRLLMRPVVGVRVGSKIYTIMEEFDGARYIANPEPVVELCKDGLYLSARGDGKRPYTLIPWDELGKEYFLTREEAEAALEEHT